MFFLLKVRKSKSKKKLFTFLSTFYFSLQQLLLKLTPTDRSTAKKPEGNIFLLFTIYFSVNRPLQNLNVHLSNS